MNENLNSNLLRNIINNLKNCFLWYMSYNDSENKVYYSETIKEVTGYSAEEISGLTEKALSLVNESERGLIKKKLKTLKSGTEKNSEELIYKITKKDNTEIWVRENIFVERNEDGSPAALYALVSNISNIKEKENELLNKVEELLALNSSKDRFISMLSHDLRAPFTSILGFAEILMNEPKLSEQERLEYLTFIHESSQNQLQLINYLLDWTRLQTGRIKIDPIRLQLQTIVFNCVSSLTGNAIRKNIDIKVDIDENLYIQADERLTIQVITNLLNNAIKFSENNTIVSVNADIFNDKFIEVIVKDQGVGISEDNKTKLFNIENMFSTEGTKGEKGTGMGLSLVKEIIKKHNGEIWFYSEQGKGSEFHFTLPRSSNLILLVENKNDEKIIYEKLLANRFTDYQVISAPNAYEAIDIIYQKLPSLIILSHELPLMDGLQVLEFLRKDDKTFRIPFIVLTESISDSLVKEYKDYGIYNLISKPVDEELLLQQVEAELF